MLMLAVSISLTSWLRGIAWTSLWTADSQIQASHEQKDGVLTIFGLRRGIYFSHLSSQIHGAAHTPSVAHFPEALYTEVELNSGVAATACVAVDNCSVEIQRA